MLYNILSCYSPWLDVLFHWNLNIPLQLQLKVHEKNNFLKNKGQKVNEKILLMYMIFLWTVLYAVYKKCLNVHFRNAGYALIRRNRISDVLWSGGFTSIIILYISFLWDWLLKPELSVIILRSFYIHYTGILIFVTNSWLRGISNFIFMLLIFGLSRQSLQPPIASIFLLKSIDVLMLDLCRLIYLKWPKKTKQIYSKSFYMTYCILWTYLYLVHIPMNLVLPYKYQSLNEKLLLCLWLATQYLDFVGFDLIKHFKSPQLLELCLFPSPSAETIHLTKILNSQKKMLNSKSKEIVLPRKELWQTLVCAMTIKKKISRLRKSKQQMRLKNSPEKEANEKNDS